MNRGSRTDSPSRVMTGCPQARKPPKNWPPNIVYLAASLCTPQVTDALRRSLQLASSAEPIEPIVDPHASRRAHTLITPISDPAHPANGQHGLFAAKDLLPGSFIVLYEGTMHTAAESDPGSDYDLLLDKETGVAVDARTCGSEARFVNDYRGVPGAPKGGNAEFVNVWLRLPRHGLLEKRVALCVRGEGRNSATTGRSRGLRKGEEILVSYGKGFWQGRIAPSADRTSLADHES